MYMLDTNILIFAIKHPTGVIVDRIIEHAVRGELCISSVTYGELEIGILKSRWPEKSRRAVESVLAGIPILSYDQQAACCYAWIKTRLEKEGIPVGDPDMMIGGHASASGCILVTHNRRHFDRMNLPLEDWLEGLQ